MHDRRIKLINCTQNIIESMLKGDAALAEALQANVPTAWSEFGHSAFRYTLDQIARNPTSVIWWTYLPILLESNTLIGSCGFKGPPNDKGQVEIGYEVAKAYCDRGYATEIAELLIEKAFRYKEVQHILAHTLAEENASVKVLKKCHFKFMGAVEIGEEEKIWKWQLDRD